MTTPAATRLLGLLAPAALTAAFCTTLAAAPTVAPTTTPALDENLVRLSLHPEHAAITPGGTVWIGVRMEIEDGWYTYWPGKNDTGGPSVVKPAGPEGVTFGDVRWPAPQRYLQPGDILDHVFRKSVTALVPVTAPADASVGANLELTFDVSWMVCSSVCIPGDQIVTLSLPVASELPQADPNTSRIIAESRARIPRPVPTDERVVKFQWNGPEVTLRVPGSYKIAFYPNVKSSIVANIHHGGEAQADFLTLRTVGEPTLLSGVLEIFSPDGHSRVIEIRSSPGSPNG